MRRDRWLTVLAAGAFVWGLSGPLVPRAEAADLTIKLGWASSAGETDPYAVGARAFKQAVEAESKGRIEVKLFPNRALGDEKALLEGMRLGTVEAGIITNAVVAQIEPAFQINDMPFLYGDEAQAQKVLDGPVGDKLRQKLAAKNVVLLGFMEGGFRAMINNVRPVTTPADVKGVKYRVMQNPVYIAMFSSLGGNAVPMAWAETFTAVQQGAIDGLEIPPTVIDQNKLFEVTKFLSLTNHTYSVIDLLMSKRVFDKQPDDLKQAIVKAAAEATKQQRAASLKASQEVIATLESKGMKVNKVADIAPFRESVKVVYEQFKPSIGADIMEDVLAAVK
jgi:tripartite ATP-independent transporter DctP family solute receptor